MGSGFWVYSRSFVGEMTGTFENMEPGRGEQREGRRRRRAEQRGNTSGQFHEGPRMANGGKL